MIPSVHPVSDIPESCALICTSAPVFVTDAKCYFTTLCFKVVVPSIPTAIILLHCMCSLPIGKFASAQLFSFWINFPFSS
eukprot:11899204-Heterocapsa_arctica.AAC.1